MNKEIRIKFLKEEIEIIKSKIQPEDCGHLYTTINTLKHTVKELEKNES